MVLIEDFEWEDLEEVSSTNDVAKEKSLLYKNQKFVITAQKQTNGRGRRGRDWIGLEGNLFASFGLEVELRYLGQFSILISLSLFETIKKYDEKINVQTKWPNDILIDEKKAIGVLLEKGEGDYLIVGIGVNICNSPKNENLLYEASSLKDINIQTDRISFLEKYINIFNQNINHWNEFGFEILKQKWLKNVYGLNEKIVVNMENEKIEGIFRDIDDNGTLLLELKDGVVRKIYAGDIFLMKEKR
ncbi:MAG: biotin--[acetyl-CoA-carboxylase] ligase [Alphaproteobacteria bacterium]